MSLRVAFVSVVPSPYQRDLFGALAARPEVELEVFYMEKAAPDSPWPERALAPHEHLMRGCWFPLGSRRVHVNWPLPDAREYDVLVLNTLMSLTAQRLMRTAVRGRPWLFWGERLGRGGRLHEWLSAPLHQAAGIAAIGSAAQADYRERFPEPRSYNIPYHCALSAFLETPRRVRSEETVTFLFCGQMIARKGLDLLMQAFSRLDDRARLLLVGREADLPAMLAPLSQDVRARIEYAGFQAPEALPGFYARADVFVLPSRHEGWGVVVNQALGAGLPILCSEAVGAGFDLVEEGVNGSRFRADDAGALENAMRAMMEEPGRIPNWGASSRAKAAEWSPEAGAAKWLAALHECARGARE